MMWLLLIYSIQPESVWVSRFAEELGVGSDQIEVRLWDGTRADYLTKEYAVEVDFGPKWAEAIGQALYYAAVERREPGILLLLKNGEDRFGYRCQTVCVRHGIRLWIKKIP